MAKGVKKIKWAQKGTVYGNHSQSGREIVIAPDQWVYFTVSEWLPNTTEDDKKKTLTWFRQSSDKKIDYKILKVPAGKDYAFRINRKNCGSFRFYIEATFSGIKDPKNDTGLLIGGYCEPKVITSQWSVGEEGITISENNPTSYGQILKLHLEVEGLNGNDCRISIFNTAIGDDLKLQKTYTARCVNGEIYLYIPKADTLAWRSQISWRKSKEQFYVKLETAGQQGFITDSKKQDKHATHLFIKDEVAVSPHQPSVVNKPAMIGNAPTSIIQFGCKFTKINVTDRDILTTVFDEKDPSTYQIRPDKFMFNLDIFYDTDQYSIRADAKPILNNLVQFLKINHQVPLLIESFTDIRQTDQYNLDLSEKRLNGVLSYLLTHDVRNNIKTAFYGESKSIQFKYFTNEDSPIHRLNRLTKLTFYTPKIKALYYNTIVPTSDTPTSLDLRVYNFNTMGSGCMLKDPQKKHDNTKAVYAELTNEQGVRTVGKDLTLGAPKLITGTDKASALKIDVFASETSFLPLVLEPRTLSPNLFFLNINSCSYFPDKNEETLTIRAFTDALWMFHASYDYDSDFFFKMKGAQQRITLVKGINTMYSRVEKYLEVYFLILHAVPGLAFGEKTQRIIIDYIKEEANMFGLAYHKRWNWLPGGKYNGFVKQADYTGQYIIFTEMIILALTVLVIIVEILITILTLGEAAVAKLPKLKKLAKLAKVVKEIDTAKKKVEDLGFDFIFPKLAMNRGMYMAKNDGEVYFVIEDTVYAKPLIAIKYEKTFKLTELIAHILTQRKEKPPLPLSEEQKKQLAKEEKELEKNLNKLAEAAGQKAELTLNFKGSIAAEFNVKMEIPVTRKVKEKISVVNQLSKIARNSSGVVEATEAIFCSAQLRLATKIVVDKWVPFLPFKTGLQVDGKLDGKVSGYFTHERKYGYDGKRGPYYKDVINFSGIKASVGLSLKATVANVKVYVSDNADSKDQAKVTNFEFVLLPPFNIVVADVELY